MTAPYQELPPDDSVRETSSARPRAASKSRSRTRRSPRRNVRRENDSWASPSDLNYAGQDLDDASDLDRVRRRGNYDTQYGDPCSSTPAYLDSRVMDHDTFARVMEVGIDGLSEEEKNNILRNVIASKNKGRKVSPDEDFDLHEKKTMLGLKVILIYMTVAAVVIMIGVFLYGVFKNGTLGEESIISGVFSTIAEIVRLVNQ